ncbi:hypothetical protein R5W23_006103 [Gemmata sp. JC673]|uniref:DUF3426 domain-containing protein n=1 Tax=Gemmata algarum TaxID=2975278 RepID=A0ABU5EWA8_9BACT|nr:MJ0042-type zinc finger domain-containing protein [Gemmata algarum]MDY3558927.1 hypothetical protein [Gemmata algarum]
MPIRLVCPSCSAALSVKDEYAGRAVKCPKCGSVIPGSASAPSASKPALPSPLPPLPQEPKAAQNLFEVVNETEEPKGERPSDKDRTRDDERGERPARRDRGDDRNDEAVAKRSKRNTPDDDRDDRPVRKKRRRDDDDYEDDEGRSARKEGRSKLTLILALVFGSLILCCGGVSLGVYYVLQKAGDRVQEVTNDLKNKAEQAEKAANSAPISITAEELAREFKANPTAAAEKYTDRTLIVDGKLSDITEGAKDEVIVSLDGLTPPPGQFIGTSVRFQMRKGDTSTLFIASRGQTIKVKGKCAGNVGDLYVNVTDATFEGAERDLNPIVSASRLLSEFALAPVATDSKYSDKAITITGAFVEKVENESIMIATGPGKKAGGKGKIRVALSFYTKSQSDGFKPGSPVTIKGEYSGSRDGTILINRAWIAH